MKNIIGFLAVVAGIAFSLVGYYNTANNPLEVAFSTFTGLGVALTASFLISGDKRLYVAAALFGSGVFGYLLYSIATGSEIPSIAMGFLLTVGTILSLIRSSFSKHEMRPA